MKTGPVIRRDWFEESMPRIENSFRLYRKGTYPEGIEAFMVLTPLKHAMRAVYGKGNLGVAWALLKDALDEWIRLGWIDFRYRIGWLNEDMKDARREIDQAH